MGYTNYWTRTSKEFTEEFVENCKKIIIASDVRLGDWNGEEKLGPTVSMEEVRFNGSNIDNMSYETFFIKNKGEEDCFNFCKTARQPYDEVVKAVLILAENFQFVKEFRFDGKRTDEEFKKGLDLLEKAGIELEYLQEVDEEEDDGYKTYNVSFAALHNVIETYEVEVEAMSEEEAEELVRDRHAQGEYTHSTQEWRYDIEVQDFDIKEI